MKVDKKAVGRKIKEFRINEGYTLEEFGGLFGASQGNASYWEKGLVLPNKARLAKMAKLMGVSVNELLDIEIEEEEEKFNEEEWVPKEPTFNLEQIHVLYDLVCEYEIKGINFVLLENNYVFFFSDPIEYVEKLYFSPTDYLILHEQGETIPKCIDKRNISALFYGDEQQITTMM